MEQVLIAAEMLGGVTDREAGDHEHVGFVGEFHSVDWVAQFLAQTEDLLSFAGIPDYRFQV